MWSVGVVLYILLSGTHPFQSATSSPEQILESILKARYEFDSGAWKGVSAPARELVCQLLEPDPAKRLTAEQLLAHPWIRGEGVSEQPLAWWASTVSLYRRLSFWGFGKSAPAVEGDESQSSPTKVAA